MRPRSEGAAVALAVAAVVVAACGARVIRPRQYPSSGEGIVFMRVKIEGLEHAMVHIFKKGDRLGPQKARIDASGVDDVYAFIINQGEYDVGQISAGMGTDIWWDPTTCPPFRADVGKNNYAGTLKLRFAYPKYAVTCDTSADSKAGAVAMFRAKYADLVSRYTMEPETR